MSRTEKDQPWWVVAEWWEPVHSCKQGVWTRLGRQVDRYCDLPAEPVYQRHDWRVMYRSKTCYWEPVWPWDYRNGRKGIAPIPAWFINHVGNAPDRRRTRDDCRRAIQEYRATGEVHVIPRTDQHRHSAGWLWS